VIQGVETFRRKLDYVIDNWEIHFEPLVEIPIESYLQFYMCDCAIDMIQVELTRMQLKRAKKRSDTQDIELAMDMMVVFSKKDDRNADSAILERLAIKLELHAIPDLKAEEIAVRKLVKERGVQNAESIQQINDLLGKFKQIAGVDETIVLDGPFSSKSLQRCRSLLIPHEFLCPITLEIMVDPVIVATGQVISH
jgi:hypothetical protein